MIGLEEATVSYHQAVELNPGYAEVYSKLEAALQEQGKKIADDKKRFKLSR